MPEGLDCQHQQRPTKTPHDDDMMMIGLHSAWHKVAVATDPERSDGGREGTAEGWQYARRA